MNESAVSEQLDNRQITLALQTYAVATRDEAGPVPLAASRKAILEAMDQLRAVAVAMLGEG